MKTVMYILRSRSAVHLVFWTRASLLVCAPQLSHAPARVSGRTQLTKAFFVATVAVTFVFAFAVQSTVRAVIGQAGPFIKNELFKSRKSKNPIWKILFLRLR